MKLTKEDYDTLYDSRFVSIENELNIIKTYSCRWDSSSTTRHLKKVVDMAQGLVDVYEAKVEAEQSEDAEELSKDYNLDMTTGLDKALSIRRGE